AWAVVARTGVPLTPMDGDVARGIFDGALVNANDTVSEAVSAAQSGQAEPAGQASGAGQEEHAGQAGQAAQSGGLGLVDDLQHLAVRRAFEDDLYFTGLLDNPAGYSRETAWQLPFLNADFMVKPDSEMSASDRVKFQRFVDSRIALELEQLDRP
ncbi:MAG: hypothetical protein ACRC0L_00795, partial [Angustibacter sp.]